MTPDIIACISRIEMDRLFNGDYTALIVGPSVAEGANWIQLVDRARLLDAERERDHWKRIAHDRLVSANQLLERTRKAEGIGSSTLPAPEWEWWAGDNDEHYSCGPHATREDAISEAISERIGESDDEGPWQLRIDIVEGRKGGVDLSKHFDAEWFIGRAHEALSDDLADENGENFDIVTSTEDEADLEHQVRSAIRAWQAERKIEITTYQFTCTRNHETITVTLDDDGRPIDEQYAFAKTQRTPHVAPSEA